MGENLNRSNQQLLQTIEKLREEIVKLQLFINIAAHELRTPIMPIIRYSEILAEDKENVKKLEELSIMQKD